MPRPNAGFFREVDEGASGRDEFLKFLVERLQEFLIEAGADLGGEHQFFGFVIADEQGAKM